MRSDVSIRSSEEPGDPSIITENVLTDLLYGFAFLTNFGTQRTKNENNTQGESV